MKPKIAGWILLPSPDSSLPLSCFSATLILIIKLSSQMLASILSEPQETMPLTAGVITMLLAQSSSRRDIGAGGTVHSTHLCFRRCHKTSWVSRNYNFCVVLLISELVPRKIAKFAIFVSIPFQTSDSFCQDLTN